MERSPINPLAACAAILVGLFFGTPAEGQPAGLSVDEVVAKNLAAKGGVEKLRAVNTVRSTGRIKTPRGTLAVTNWAKRPNKTRREIAMEGQTQVLAFDGKVLWGINPLISSEPRPITGPAAERTRQDVEDFDSVLLDYKEKGYKVELLPVEGVHKGPRLKVTKTNGTVQEIQLDPDTFLEERITMSVTQEGKTGVVMTEFSNYRQVDGLMVPFTIRQYFNGQPQGEVVYETIQFNLPLADDFFQLKQ